MDGLRFGSAEAAASAAGASSEWLISVRWAHVRSTSARCLLNVAAPVEHVHRFSFPNDPACKPARLPASLSPGPLSISPVPMSPSTFMTSPGRQLPAARRRPFRFTDAPRTKLRPEQLFRGNLIPESSPFLRHGFPP